VASTPLDPALAKRLIATGYIEQLNAVAAALHEEGYHGPVCIDGIAGPDVFVPILEVNARMSMGGLCIAAERGAGSSALAKLSFDAGSDRERLYGAIECINRTFVARDARATLITPPTAGSSSPSLILLRYDGTAAFSEFARDFASGLAAPGISARNHMLDAIVAGAS
jgi:hypothetical protein